MENFDLNAFTEAYIKDAGKWSYLYYTTLRDLKDLLDEPVDITQYLVKEVSVSDMLAIIESAVGLAWFINSNNGAALIRESAGGYELYYRGERDMEDQVIAKDSNLRNIVLLKLRKDLFWIRVQNIKD